MADIFLSYARADQAKIERLAAALEEAGYTLWWDKQIRGGKSFGKDIERAIKGAKAVVVAWSAAAAESHWVLDEASYARDSGKLVPIRIDDAEIPFGYRQVQAIDFSSGLNDDSLEELTAALDELVGGESHVAHAPPGRISRSRLALVAALAVVLLGALGWWALQRGVSGAPAEAAVEQADDKSIAILPFRDLSPQQESWFSDGLAQEISAALTRTPDLKVAPTSESFRFRERAQSMQSIGSELGVAHILDGTVRRSADRIVVDIELIHVSEGTRIFTQRYDRPLADTITIQEQIATRIARALDTALDPEALADLIDSGTNSVEAYEELLRGNDLLDDIGADGYEVLAHFRRAADLDPQWSRAYSAIADTISNILSAANSGADFDADRTALGEEFQRSIERAAATARSDIDRDNALFVSHYFNGEFRLAERDAKRLTRQAPENGVYWSGLGAVQVLLGKTAAAIGSFDRFAQASNEDWASIVNRYYDGRAYEKAAAAYDSTPENARGDATFVYQSHRALLSVGRVREAAVLEREMRRYAFPDDFKTLVSIRQACAERDRARAMRLVEGLSDRNARWQALMMLGRTEEAIAVMRPFDFAEPPYPIADLLFYPFFDPRPFPNLMKVMAREDIPVPERLFYQPPACPPAKAIAP